MAPKKEVDAVPPLQNKPSTGWTNPTPLDMIFIVFLDVTLLLLLLWILPGNGDKFSNAPPFLTAIVSSVWSKVAAAGGSVGAFLLRKFFDTRPAPNYLIWIPGFLLFLIGTLFLLSKALPGQQLTPQQLRMNARISLDIPASQIKPFAQGYKTPDFNLWEEAPDQVPVHGVFSDESNPSFPYSDTLNVNRSKSTNAKIKISPWISHQQNKNSDHDYQICLQAGKSWPTDINAGRMVLACASGSCGPVQGVDPGYVSSCDAKVLNQGSFPPTVYAAEMDQPNGEPGWDVPTLETLRSMSDRQRIGYTVFDVSFTPEGPALNADAYYYELRANSQPIYIDGLRPGLKTWPLTKGQVNHVAFALENLNFTGQYEGQEKLHLTMVFLKGNAVVFRQDLERDYIALRKAAVIPQIKTQVGSFSWTGDYVPGIHENKYEIFLGSAVCPAPPQKECVDRAVYAKNRFDKGHLVLNSKPAVMVIRPPLRKNPSYGLALGLVQSTGQVQFTFDEDEASQLCHLATGQVGKGSAGKLIQPDLRRYDVATEEQKPCR